MRTRRLAAIFATHVVGFSRLRGTDEEGTLLDTPRSLVNRYGRFQENSEGSHRSNR
jgi:hypothetical protein